MNAGTGGLLGVMNSGPVGHGAAANSVATTTAQLHSDDGSKKIRKPSTITKSGESWAEQEHDKFLEALQLGMRQPMLLILNLQADGTEDLGACVQVHGRPVCSSSTLHKLLLLAFSDYH